MKWGKWELVSCCRRELWLNSLALAVSAAASTGWGIRVQLREPDIKPTPRHDILFSWAALTQIQLSTYYFLMPVAREVAHKKKTHWQSAPRCPCSSFTFNSNNLQIVFMTEDKDVPLVRTLSFWLKEILDLRVPLNWAEGARLHVHAIVSVNLCVNIRHVDKASPYIWFSVCVWGREWQGESAAAPCSC